MSSNLPSHSTSQLRFILRTQRRAIPQGMRFRYHKQIQHNLLRAGILKHQHIALYISFDGEVNLEIVMQLLRGYRKSLYIPILNNEKLTFVVFKGHYAHNKYGIKEPLYPQRIFTKHITLLLTPLVGFDTKGNRLGMGKGYYDKTLSFLHSRKYFTLPKRWGVAYSIQYTPLVPNSWDISLNKIITELSELNLRK